MDSHACVQHLRTLAALLCTSKQLRRLVDSPAAAEAWSQASITRHFDWRRWRRFSSAKCSALHEWLEPRTRLVTHAGLDLHISADGTVEAAFLQNLTALQSLTVLDLREEDSYELELWLRASTAPVSHLSCHGCVPPVVPCPELRSLSITLAACSEDVLASVRGLLPTLPLLQRLEIHFGFEYTDYPFQDDRMPLSLQLLETLQLPELTELVLSQTHRFGIYFVQGRVSDPERPLLFLALEHWLAMQLLQENECLPKLQRFCLDLGFIVTLPFSDPEPEVSLKLFSLVQYSSSGSHREIVHRTMAYDELDGDRQSWGRWTGKQGVLHEMWEFMGGELESLTCPLDIREGSQRFKAECKL